MINLAGIEPTEANAAVLAELGAAGVTAVEPFAPDARAEVQARYRARLRFARGRVVTLTRRWAYWVAWCERQRRLADARRVNDRPCGGPRGHYSGRGPNLGAVARAFGYAGGMGDAQLADWCAAHGGVDAYDVDTAEGLAGLVAALRELYGEPAAPPACPGAPDAAAGGP